MEPEFAMQGGSTSNDKGDCNGRYQCKMTGEDFIEGYNYHRKFLWEWYIILGGSCGIAMGDTSSRWGETSKWETIMEEIFCGVTSLHG